MPNTMEERIKVLEKKMDNILELLKDLKVEMQSVQASTHSLMSSVLERQKSSCSLLSGLRTDMAGLGSGLARRDSAAFSMRSPQADTEDSGLILSQPGLRNTNVAVLEVTPWEPTPEVAKALDTLLKRQFLMFPWVREKRLRGLIRNILKEHLQAGPLRRSTVTKIVFEAQQMFQEWRNKIKEKMFDNWNLVQDDIGKAANIIFEDYKAFDNDEEVEGKLLYAEHMVEVGQYLRRKIMEKRRNNSMVSNENHINVSSSKFWYEVRKKIMEILESQKIGDSEDGNSDGYSNDSKIR